MNPRHLLHGPLDSRHMDCTLQIRQKRGSSSIIEWALGQGLEEEASRWQELLRATTSAILVAGAKTITHMATYVERLEALVRFLLLKCPPQARRPRSQGVGFRAVLRSGGSP